MPTRCNKMVAVPVDLGRHKPKLSAVQLHNVIDVSQEPCYRREDRAMPL